MASSALRNRLDDVFGIIAELRFVQDAQKTIQYRLAPFLQENAAINGYFESKALYYLRLASSAAYTQLVDATHESLRQLHGMMDREKLNGSDRPYENPFNHLRGTGRRLSEQEIYSILVLRNLWYKLGDPEHRVLDDSYFAPWRPVFDQYVAVESFLEDVGTRSGLGVKAGIEACWTFVDQVGQIRQQLEGPWYGQAIADFEGLLQAIEHPLLIFNSDDIDAFKVHASRVHKELSLFLDAEEEKPQAVAQEVTTKRGGERARVEYDKQTRTFSYRKKSYAPRRNSIYLSLCDAFYPNCPKSGRMHWSEVRAKLNDENPQFATTDREKFREWIRSLNRWAEDPVRDLGPFLKLEKNHIVRLK